jgi:hypothetical protein
MRHSQRTRWYAALVSSASACLVMAVAPTAQGAPDTAHALAAPGAAGVRHVFLIDGTRLSVGLLPGGGQTVVLHRAARPAGLLTLRAGDRMREIPAVALPFLGRGLSPSLIDLGALEKAESGGRLPVRVTFGGRAPKLPGVTVVSVGRGSERGYLTAAGATAFGAALARQFRADHGRASYGKDGMFAGGVQVALADAPAARVTGPRFRLHTLTLAATDARGRPDSGDFVFLMNEDNPLKFADPVESMNVFDHGTAKFSVPAGHYWAIGDFASLRGNNTRLVVLPQFTVRRSRTVHLSARAATSQIGFTTPRPSTLQVSGFTVIRGAANGATFSFGFFGAGLSLRVNPTTRKPSVGTLRSFTSAQLTSSSNGSNAAYAYNLNYAGPPGRIPADQHFDARPASLATVTETYVQDVHSTGDWGVFGGFRPELTGFLIAVGFPLSLPRRQIQYFSADPSLAWSSFYDAFDSLKRFGGGQSDAFRVYSPGQQMREEWSRYPLHPQPDVQPLDGVMGAALPAYVSASRTGNTLNLAPVPFSDNYPGHLGSPAFSFVTGKLLAAGSYAIYQNGMKIAHGDPFRGIKPVRLNSRPSSIKFVLSAHERGPGFPLSTATTTVWTWRTARRPGATVPRNWFCGFTRHGLVRRCAVQPIVTLNYSVHGLASDGRTHPGPQEIDLDVGHLQLAAPARITSATAQVSFNGGQKYRPASVTSLGGGRFLIGFTAPAGVDVTLRVRAVDAAGGSITETIQRAYGVAS